MTLSSELSMVLLLQTAAADYAAAAREHMDALASAASAPGDHCLREACNVTQWRLDECTRLLHWHALHAAGWSDEKCDEYLFSETTVRP